MNISLSAFGGVSATQTNAIAATRTAAAEFFVNFDQFDSRLSLFLSGIASTAATPTQAPIIEAWATSVEGDASGTASLLGTLTLPLVGVGSLTGFDSTVIVDNPGGEKYVVFTTRAGLNGAAPVTLSFRSLVLSMDAPDADVCPLAKTTTLIKLRNGAKEIADKVNDASVSDATWNVWINQGVASLWSLVSTAFADHFFKTYDFTLTGGSAGNILDVSTLPDADFRRIRMIEWMPDTGSRRRVRAFNWDEKDARTASYAQALWCNIRRYRLMGQKLYVEPYEQASGPYRLYYIPAPATLSLTCDALDPAVDEWAEYPMVFAAMKALGKEESDDSQPGRRLADLKAEILDAAATRNAGDVDVIADVESGSGGGYWGA